MDLGTAYEINLGTDPNRADTDGDGMNDGDEVAVGRDPLVADVPAPPGPSIWGPNGPPHCGLVSPAPPSSPLAAMIGFLVPMTVGVGFRVSAGKG
jgi:hypothetical protein